MAGIKLNSHRLIRPYFKSMKVAGTCHKTHKHSLKYNFSISITNLHFISKLILNKQHEPTNVWQLLKSLLLCHEIPLHENIHHDTLFQMSTRKVKWFIQTYMKPTLTIVWFYKRTIPIKSYFHDFISHTRRNMSIDMLFSTKAQFFSSMESMESFLLLSTPFFSFNIFKYILRP